MEDDVFDIYDDLEEFDYKVKYEEAQDTIKTLQWQLDSVLKTVNGLESQNAALQTRAEDLERSFQSLLLTARSEIKRKDAQIAAVRREKDDIIFRRKDWYATNNPETQYQHSRNHHNNGSSSTSRHVNEGNPFRNGKSKQFNVEFESVREKKYRETENISNDPKTILRGVSRRREQDTSTSKTLHSRESDERKIEKRGDRNDQQKYDKQNVKWSSTSADPTDKPRDRENANRVTQETKDSRKQINKVSDPKQSTIKEKESSILMDVDKGKDHKIHQKVDNKNHQEDNRSGAKFDNDKSREDRKVGRRTDNKKTDSNSREKYKDENRREERSSENKQKYDNIAKSSEASIHDHKTYDSRRNYNERDDSRRRDHKDDYEDRYRSRNIRNSDTYYDRRHHRDKEHEESHGDSRKEKHNRDDKYNRNYDRDCNSEGTSRSKSNEDRKNRYWKEDRSRDNKRRGSREDDPTVNNVSQTKRTDHGESRYDKDRSDSNKDSLRYVESKDHGSTSKIKKYDQEKNYDKYRKSRDEKDLLLKSKKRGREEENHERPSKRIKPSDKEKKTNQKTIEKNQKTEADNFDSVDSLSEDYLSVMKRQLELEIYGELSSDENDGNLMESVTRSIHAQQKLASEVLGKNQSPVKAKIIITNTPITTKETHENSLNNVTTDNQLTETQFKKGASANASDNIKLKDFSRQEKNNCEKENKTEDNLQLIAGTDRINQKKEASTDTLDEISNDGALEVEGILTTPSQRNSAFPNDVQLKIQSAECKEIEIIRSADISKLSCEKQETSTAQEHFLGSEHLNDKPSSTAPCKNVQDVQAKKNTMSNDKGQQSVDLSIHRHQQTIKDLSAIDKPLQNMPNIDVYVDANIDTSTHNRFDPSDTSVDIFEEHDEDIFKTPIKAPLGNVPNNMRNGIGDDDKHKLGSIKKDTRKRSCVKDEKLVQESKKKCEAVNTGSNPSQPSNQDHNRKGQTENVNNVVNSTQSEPTVKANPNVINKLDDYGKLILGIYSEDICESLMNDIPNDENNQSMHFSSDSIFGDQNCDKFISPSKLCDLTEKNKEPKLELKPNVDKTTSAQPKKINNTSENIELLNNIEDRNQHNKLVNNIVIEKNKNLQNLEGSRKILDAMKTIKSQMDEVHKQIFSVDTNNSCGKNENMNSSKNQIESPAKEKSIDCVNVPTIDLTTVSENDKESKGDENSLNEKYVNLKEDMESKTSTVQKQTNAKEQNSQKINNSNDEQIVEKIEYENLNSEITLQENTKKPTKPRSGKGKVERKEPIKKDSKLPVPAKKSLKSKNTPIANVSTESISGTSASGVKTIQSNFESPIKSNKLQNKSSDISGTSIIKSKDAISFKASYKSNYSLQGVKMVGHIIDGFEREPSPQTSNLDSSRELKNELFKEALGITNSTPLKTIKTGSFKLFDTSSSDSSAELKSIKYDQKTTDTANSKHDEGSPALDRADTDNFKAIKTASKEVDFRKIECSEATETTGVVLPDAGTKCKIQVLDVQIISKGSALNDPRMWSVTDNSEKWVNNLADSAESEQRDGPVLIENKICFDATEDSTTKIPIPNKKPRKRSNKTLTSNECKQNTLKETPKLARTNIDDANISSNVSPVLTKSSNNKHHESSSQSMCGVVPPGLNIYQTPVESNAFASPDEPAIETCLNATTGNISQQSSEYNASDAEMSASQNEKRNISIASTNYLIEKVDSNVVNVFITRKKVKKKKKD